MARRFRLRALTCALGLAVPLGCLPVPLQGSAPVPSVHPFAGHVREAAARFGIPEAWIWRVMHAESRGNPRARSHAGAMGLMQIMPGTWAMLTARHGLGEDPWAVRANIHAGAAYLRQMWDRYGDVALMLAAYSAGPGRADAYRSGRRGLPAETRAYVARIAPELGRASVQLPPAAPPRPADWRDARLFAAAPGPASSDGGAAAGLQPGRGETAAAAAPAATDAGLFAPLSGRTPER